MLLSVNVFASLDGVMQGPGALDEDPSNGFTHGGWLVPHLSEHTHEVVEGWFRAADAFLLGRTSYGMLGSYWPQVTAPEDLIAARLNTLPKYVVSSTLTDEEATWNPTTILRGDLVENVLRLKASAGRELQVHGSWELVQALHNAGLVDVYRVLQFPVVVGTGKRLFSEGSTPATLATTRGEVLAGGIVSLTVKPVTSDVLTAGRYTVDGGRSTRVLD